MAGKIFVDPEQVKTYAGQIKALATDIDTYLKQASGKMQSTESNYQSQAASDMRSNFAAMQGDFQRFVSYLTKIANYLEQNVADPVQTLNQAHIQEVANIRKPK